MFKNLSQRDNEKADEAMVEHEENSLKGILTMPGATLIDAKVSIPRFLAIFQFYRMAIMNKAFGELGSTFSELLDGCFILPRPFDVASQFGRGEFHRRIDANQEEILDSNLHRKPAYSSSNHRSASALSENTRRLAPRLTAVFSINLLIHFGSERSATCREFGNRSAKATPTSNL